MRLKSWKRNLRWVSGNMLALPFKDESFDLVTSISVLEHLDTEVSDRSYVPYPRQREQAAQALKEMIRLTKSGGYIYITSDCCNYVKAKMDTWRGHYYFGNEGPDISSAWPVDEVQEIFYDFLTEHGCSLVGPTSFSPVDLDGDERFEGFRGPFFSAFTVLARKNGTESAGAYRK